MDIFGLVCVGIVIFIWVFSTIGMIYLFCNAPLATEDEEHGFVVIQERK